MRATLEDQAKGPPVNPIEMGMKDLGAVIERVRRIPGYKPYFVKAFGAGDIVTMDNAARAIAAYERTLITPGSAYDRYATGERGALTAAAQRGLAKFAAVGCTTCHQGPAFNGAVKSLPEAVRVMASVQLDAALTDAEVADIVAFLEALTGPFPAQTMPRLPPTPGDLIE